ncbi:MBG domain-containing protein [Solitalea lacus]|uniref:MBG domain-containing protein n=1 Tax=Solitalea lacus TaxID=2911172 RepID=UPI001EDAD4F1|nr:MBG domain-containing protein [Solitalea lacus]UKJ06974.1 YDG domain-containing protein [Solitalea lacus]
MSVGSQTGSVIYGTGGMVTYLITVTANGAGASTALNIQDLPAGVTASFSPSTLIVAKNGSTTSTLTLTISTSAAATAGVTFRVTESTDRATVDGTLVIDKRPLTISGVTANNKVYNGTTTSTLNTGGAILSNLVIGDDVTLNSGSASGVFADKNVGTNKTVTITGFGISGSKSSNYTLSQPSAFANITAKALTETGLSANNKTYDGTNVATLTGTAVLLSPETIGTGADNDGKPFIGDVVGVTNTSVGTFAGVNVSNGIVVTPSGQFLTGAQAGNYTLILQSLRADIIPKSLTASITTADKIYDGSTAATTVGSVPTADLISGDIVNVIVSNAHFDTKNVGVNKPVTATVAIDNANYILSSLTASTTADIIAKDASITANAKTKTYGDDNPELDAEVTGAVNGEVLNYSLSTDALKYSNVGTYPISVSLGDNPNYNVTVVNALLTIGQKAANVTANAKAKTYGDDNPELDAEVTGTVNGDVLNFSLSTDALKYSNVGTYPIAVSLGDNPNYNVTVANALLTIGQKAANVTANAKAKTYGDDNPELDAQVTGTVNGDVLNYSLSTDVLKYSNVGTYPISVNLGDNPNYNVTAANALLTIGQKAANVTANTKAKTYGDDNPELDAEMTGTVNGDVLNYSLSTDALKYSNVGTYPISVSLGDNPNYNVTVANALLTIGQKAANVTANAKAKTYGDDNPELDAEVTGTVNGDVLNYSLSTDALKDSNVGTYPISVSLGDNPNYNVTAANALLTISQKALTIIAHAKTKVYGTSDPELTCQMTNGSLVNGETFNDELTRDPGEQIGNYAIKPSELNFGLSNNYSLTYIGANLTITTPVSDGSATKSFVIATPHTIHRNETVRFMAHIQAGVNGSTQAATQVTFKIGETEVGTVPLEVIGINLTGSLQVSLTSVIPAVVVGDNIVTAVFTGVNPNFKLVSPITTINVTDEAINGDFLTNDKKGLDAHLLPNPSVTDFTLQIENASDEDVEVRVVDINTGQQLELVTGKASDLIHFGSSLGPGLYSVVVRQGSRQVALRAMKL